MNAITHVIASFNSEFNPPDDPSYGGDPVSNTQSILFLAAIVLVIVIWCACAYAMDSLREGRRKSREAEARRRHLESLAQPEGQPSQALLRRRAALHHALAEGRDINLAEPFADHEQED